MSIVQFLRIFWARRWFIVAATLACLAGALVVTRILPPRWEAHSRVMLNLLKPDPVTGLVMAGPATRAYASTQIELITDYAVAGKLADELGLQSDPNLIEAYNRRSSRDTRDFRRWVADLIISNSKAKILEDSNILEIDYTATEPDMARKIADGLRTAYLDASLQFRRDDAQRNAEWFGAQADKAKASYDAAVQARTEYEKANGIVMADEKTDIDSARLAALAGQAGVATPMMAPSVLPSSPSAVQLAQVDAQIAEASKTLGPNHPVLAQLRAQRQTLAQLAAKDEAAARSAAAAASGASSAGVGALERAVAAQKAKVIGKADQIAKLTQLQSEVSLRHDEFVVTAAKAAQFHQEAAAGDAGLTPLGAAVAPKSATFPNYWLIIPGSLFLGLAVGVLTALLMELFGRRVRGVEDLRSAAELPLLAVVAAAEKPRRARLPRLSLPARQPRMVKA